MNECDLSTTVLMQEPFNLKQNDAVLPRYAARNAIGLSDWAECVETTTSAKIRTNACTPSNLVRDTTNADDKANGGSKLCFTWDKCVDDNLVMFKFYSQAFNLNTNRLIGAPVEKDKTDTEANDYCMDIPSDT